MVMMRQSIQGNLKGDLGMFHWGFLRLESRQSPAFRFEFFSSKFLPSFLHLRHFLCSFFLLTVRSDSDTAERFVGHPSLQVISLFASSQFFSFILLRYMPHFGHDLISEVSTVLCGDRGMAGSSLTGIYHCSNCRYTSQVLT